MHMTHDGFQLYNLDEPKIEYSEELKQAEKAMPLGSIFVPGLLIAFQRLIC
jgi:hypothetical protein